MELSTELPHESSAEACETPHSPPSSERQALLDPFARPLRESTTTLLQVTKSNSMRHRSALGLVIGVLVSAYLVSRLGFRGTLLSNKMMIGEDEKLCGHSEANVEYHTNRSLQRVPNMYSQDMCCAA